MTAILISCIDSIVKHYGSCCNCPVNAFIDKTTQTFIKINKVPITTTSNTLTVPTHTDPSCKNSHEHQNLPIDFTQQNYIRVNGYVVCIIGDKNIREDTRIENAGNNNFIFVNI